MGPWHSAWTLVVWACLFRLSLSAQTVAVSKSVQGASIDRGFASQILGVSGPRQRYQAQAAVAETACTAFSVTQTNSADANYAVCSIYACAGETIVMSTCSASAGACTGDTYLKLYTSSAVLLDADDDGGCSSCARIEYAFTLSCQTYELREGCYGTGACSGTTAYYTKTVATSRVPTAAPTPTHAPSPLPSSQPTCSPSGQPSSQPSAQPVMSPTSAPSAVPSAAIGVCPAYDTTNTNYAVQNYVTCPVYACAETLMVISTCYSEVCTGDTYIQLWDLDGNMLTEDDDGGCSSCAEIQYTFTSSCQYYEIRQGCFGDSSCGATTYYYRDINPDTKGPTVLPTPGPTSQPSSTPSAQPSSEPTNPTSQPSSQPSAQPTSQPTAQPTTEPSGQPTARPSDQPTSQPTSLPTGQPTGQPSSQPTGQPSSEPTGQPSSQPSSQPTGQPSSQPSGQPSSQPSSQPTGEPSGQPSSQPTGEPSGQPSFQPSSQPSSQPSRQPSMQPSSQPTGQPSSQPAGQPKSQPSSHPSPIPTLAPTSSGSQVYFSGSQVISGITQAEFVGTFGVQSAWAETIAEYLAGDKAYLMRIEPTSFTATSRRLGARDKHALESLTIEFSVSFSALDFTGSEEPSTSVLSSTVQVFKSAFEASVADSDFGADFTSHFRALTGENSAPSIVHEGAVISETYTVLVTEAQPSQIPTARPSTAAPTRDERAPVIQNPIAFNRTATSFELTVEFLSGAAYAGNVYCKAFVGSTKVLVSVGEVVSGGSTFPYLVGASTVTGSVTGLKPLQAYTLYCSAVTIALQGSLLADVKATRFTSTTTCCKSLTFTNAPASLYGDPSKYTSSQTSQYVFRYALGNAPFSAMEVQPVLSTADGMIVPSSVVATLPLSTSFGPTSTVLTGSFIIVADSSAFVQGAMSLMLTLTGASPVEYYPLLQQITLLSTTDPPSPPDLVSSKFSDDGAAIFMYFDSDTDQIASGFCSSTFTFKGSERARCSWLNVSTVMGRFDSSPIVANAAPGDVLSLLANRVKAKCTQGSACDAYTYSAAQSVTISTATSPVRPIIVVSVPSSISYCENVTVDASLSSGHGGRTWASVSWSISAPGFDTTELLALFASNGYSLDQVVSFPAAVLLAGPSYIFSMTATNFLGVESSGTAIITVSGNPNLPSLQVLGSSLFTVTPADTLIIYSGVTISPCAEKALTFTTSWRVATTIGDEVEDVEYEPLSKTPSVLIVGPHTLQPGRRYSVFVTTVVGATALNPSVSATAHAFIDVEDGGVVAVVGGGDERLVFPTGTARIDASKSYDENFESAAESILEFSWTCSMQSVLNFGQTCSSVIESGSGSSSVLLVSGPLLLEREVYAFSVVVAAPDGRFGTKTVMLLVQDAASSTVVAIDTPPAKVNADSRLTLTAELEANYALTGTWAAYLGSTQLDITTLTPQKKTFSASDVRAGIDFAIVVPRNVLSAGTVVRFRLLADRANFANAGTKYQSYSEVSIVINAPPSSGSLRTLPSAGNALQTPFKLSAVGWTDVSEDLPLAYLFSYIQNPESPALVTQARSGKNTASTDLPQGLEYLEYAIEIEVVIYDALLASTNDTAVVTVVPAALNVSDYLAAQLAKFETTGTVSDATLLINNVVTALGVKNCTAANQTFCESRNRKPCTQKPNTCGSCSAGYIGIVGASNAKCVPQSRRLSDSYTLVGNSCTDDDGCVLGNCFHSVCEAPAQTCPSTTEDVCSGFGSCAFADNNGAERFNCTVLDTNCFATCVCEEGRGGYGCSLTTAELLYLDETRRVLCDLFVLVASLSNPSADLMDSFVGTMYATYEPVEVVTVASFNACSNAMQIVTKLAAAGLLQGTQDDTSSRLVQVASRFITASNGSSNSSTSSSNEQLADIAKGLLLTMADGQVDTEVATDTLKLTASKGQASTIGKISPPVSESQEAYGQGPSVSMELAKGAALACDSGAGYVDLSLAEWGKNPFPGASDLSTPQLKFESRTPTDSRRRRRLQSSSSTVLGPGDVKYYIIFKYNSAQNFSTNDPYRNSTFPECTTYDATSQTYVGCQNCALATFTDFIVTFACFSIGNLCGSSSSGRRLADDDGGAVDDGGFSGEQTSVTSIQYSALLDTFTGVLGTNPFAASWQGAKGVFSFVLSLLMTFILGLVYFRRWDINDHNCMIYSGKEIQSQEEKGRARSKGGLKSGFGSFGGLDGANEPFESNKWAATSFFQPGLSQAGSVDDGEVFGAGDGASSSWSVVSSKDGVEEFEDIEVIDSYLEALIPIEGLNGGTVDIWMQLRAMFESHPLTGVFGGPSLKETRVLRWTTLCLVFLMTLFIDTLFFSTFYPSAGECETYTDETACITPQNSAVSSPLCTWGADRSLENGGTCAASPPPSDFVFAMIVVLMIIIIAVPLSFLYEYLLVSVCAFRPEFEVWGWSTHGILGSSTQSVGLYDTSKLQPAITILRDKSRVEMHEAAHTNSFSRTMSAGCGGHEDLEQLAADTLAVYNELLNVDVELDEMLTTTFEYLRIAQQRERINEDGRATVDAIRSTLGVNSDGTPVPLSTFQWIWYGSARKRLRAKLKFARKQEQEIRTVLGQLGSSEILGKDIALIQYFVLEQFSAFKRYALRAHFFAFDTTSSLPIHPAKWLAGWAFVLLSALFFIYWALAWGIATETAMVNLWAQNFALALFQDMAIIAVFRQYIVYMIATLTIKPQLNVIYRLLQKRAIEYVQDTLPPLEGATVVQHFSPACRVSRLKIAEHLAAATILRTISDVDAHEAKQAHNSHIPWVALLVVSIPVVVGVYSKAAGELMLDTVLPTLLSMLIVVHYLLYTYSAALLALPYLGLLLFFYLRWAWYRRAQERVAQAIARGGRMESVTQWRRRQESAKHDPLLRHVCMGCYNNLVDLAAYCVVLCSHPENIFKILYRRFRGEAKKDNSMVVWRQMNYPQKLQGCVVSADRAKKDQAKRAAVPAAAIKFPRSIQALAKDWSRGWEAQRRSSYMKGLLQVVGVVTAGPGEYKDDTPLGMIVLKALHPERYRSDVAKLYAYRFGHTTSSSMALVQIISRYRDQVAAASIVCITLQDEEAIMAIEEDDDLLEYAGGIHVRDLALMLEALLHVFNPGKRPLRQHQMRYFLKSYDDWVMPHCVPTKAEMDPLLLSLRRERGPKAYYDQGHLELEEFSRFARKYEWLHPRHNRSKESTGRWSFVRTIVDREERHRLEVRSRLMRTEHAEVRRIAEAKVKFDEFVAWFVDCARKCPTP